jgi:hypothetical protein
LMDGTVKHRLSFARVLLSLCSVFFPHCLTSFFFCFLSSTSRFAASALCGTSNAGDPNCVSFF